MVTKSTNMHKMSNVDEMKKDQRVITMMTRAELKALDDWAHERRIRSRGEAVRQLIAMGVKATATGKTE